MPLPFKVKSLEAVPEGARALYEKRGEEYVLPVDGVRPEEEFLGLKTKLDGAYGERDRYRSLAERVKDEDLTDLERLRKEEKERKEKRLQDEGQWEQLRTQLSGEYETKLGTKDQEITGLNSVIEELTVQNQLLAALGGVREDARAAVQALLEKRGPKVKWVDQNGKKRPVGVFPDQLHGDKPISEYVEAWLQTDEAKPFLPAKTKPGGGATGAAGSGGNGKSWEGKRYADMTMDEKKEFLDSKYGAGAA